MRFMLLFHLILLSPFISSSSSPFIDGIFQTLEQFVTLEEGGLRLKAGIMEIFNQLDFSHLPQKIIKDLEKLVKEYIKQKGVINAGGAIDLSSLGSYGIHILLRQIGNGFTAHLTLPGPLQKFKDIAEKLSGSWVPLADEVLLNVTITSSETSEDGNYLTTVSYQLAAELLQIAKLSSGEKGNWSMKSYKTSGGTLAVESRLEGGIWRHGFNISDAHNSAQEADMQFSIGWPVFGWEDPEMVKEIYTSFTQGPKHREIRASFTGSWSGGFSLESLLLPLPYDAPSPSLSRFLSPWERRMELEKWRVAMDNKIWGSALISNDKSGKRWNEPGKTWTMQLMKREQVPKPIVHQHPGAPSPSPIPTLAPLRPTPPPLPLGPTHNFTVTIQENGFLVTGEMNTLLVSKIIPSLGYDRWRVDGHRPYSLFVNFTMPILPGSGQTLPEGPQSVLVAKIDCVNSQGYNKARIYPNLLRFNKALVTINPTSNKLEIFLNNEKHPDNGEFVSKFSYEVERSDLPLSWTLKYALVTHYKSKTQYFPDPKYFEKFSGNYTWIGFEENQNKFKLDSEERFTSEYNYDDSISFPLYGLWNVIFENRYARSGGYAWPLTGPGRTPGWVDDKIQLDVRRTIVYERNLQNLLLVFYRNQWETEGKLLQVEQTVELDGDLWHHLNYTVTPADERRLKMDFFFHNDNKDVWKQELKYATGFWKNKNSLTSQDLEYARGSWKDKSKLTIQFEGSEPGFFLEHKINHADNSTADHVLHSMTAFVELPFYPKSNGLKWEIDLKKNMA